MTSQMKVLNGPADKSCHLAPIVVPDTPLKNAKPVEQIVDFKTDQETVFSTSPDDVRDLTEKKRDRLALLKKQMDQISEKEAEETNVQTVEAQNKEKSNKNSRFIIGFASTVMIGMFNYGFVFACWNALQTPFQVRYAHKEGPDKWQEGDSMYWSVTLSTVTIIAAMISSLSGGWFMYFFHKHTLVLACDTILIVGSSLTLIDNMKVIFAGRVLHGFAIGGLGVFCPNIVNELVPTESKGQYSSAQNCLLNVGIIVTALFGLAIPEKQELEAEPNSFWVQHYWRVIWTTPIVTTLVQMTLLLTVFRYPTPAELKADGPKGNDRLKQLMSKMYSADLVEERIESIKSKNRDEARGLSWKDTFVKKKTRGAAWMAVVIAGCSHINLYGVLILYSSFIFEQIGFSVKIGNFILLLFNLLGNLPAFFMMKAYGRRTNQLISMIALNFLLKLIGICVLFKYPIIHLCASAIFVAMAQIGVLPVGWSYMHEVTNSKGVAVSTAFSIFLLIPISMFSKPLLENETVGGYTFIIFAGINWLCTFVVIARMKETKGLTEAEVSALYVTEDKLDEQVRPLPLYDLSVTKPKDEAECTQQKKEKDMTKYEQNVTAPN